MKPYFEIENIGPPATGCPGLDAAQTAGLWLDRLIEAGDPGDLVSLLHRQQAWLELIRVCDRKG